MPGNRARNLRSGDLNEEFGFFMLRMLGAVAPVPRTEDVGVDAFLTLLHDRGKLLSAGRTCMVQFKSDSVKCVAFKSSTRKGTAVSPFDWLKGLEYPLLFGRISVDTSLRLYSTNELLGWFTNHPTARSVTVRFDFKKGAPPNDDPEATTVFLGDPVVTISASEATLADRRNRCVDLLDQTLALLAENLATFPVGMATAAVWRTNEPLQRVATHIHPSEPDERRSEDILRRAASALMPLAVERLYHGEDSDLGYLKDLLIALDRDSESFKFDDQHRTFLDTNVERLRAYRQEHRATKGGVLLPWPSGQFQES